MRAEVCKALLKRIPENQHGSLVVMTEAGTEINVQVIVRVEDDLLVLRGRLAGTMDTGRTFFLPYERLDHIGFFKELTEAQVSAILDGRPMPPAAKAGEEAPPPAPEQQSPPPPATPSTPAPAAAEPPSAGKANSGLIKTLPSKSKIIERLRLRAAAAARGDDAPAPPDPGGRLTPPPHLGNPGRGAGGEG